MTKFNDAEQLAALYLEDDIISWNVTGGSKRNQRFVKKTFRKLENELGVDFKRSRSGDPEITVDYVDSSFIDPDFGTDWLGTATIGSWGSADIVVKNDIPTWKSTAVHEILHGLGLDHNHDVVESAMSYTRDYTKHQIYEYDWNLLHEIYDPLV